MVTSEKSGRVELKKSQTKVATGLFLIGAEVAVPQELESQCSFRSYSQKFTLGLLPLPL